MRACVRVCVWGGGGVRVIMVISCYFSHFPYGAPTNTCEYCMQHSSYLSVCTTYQVVVEFPWRRVICLF